MRAARQAISVVAGAMLLLFGNSAAGQEGGAAPDGSVTGDAGPSVDEGVIQLVLRETHPHAEGAVSTARFHLRTLQGALEQAPFPVDEVTVGELRVEPVLEEELLPVRPGTPRETRVVGYRAVIPVRVTTPEPAALGSLVQVAERAGAELESGKGEPIDPTPTSGDPGGAAGGGTPDRFGGGA